MFRLFLLFFPYFYLSVPPCPSFHSLSFPFSFYSLSFLITTPILLTPTALFLSHVQSPASSNTHFLTKILLSCNFQYVVRPYPFRSFFTSFSYSVFPLVLSSIRIFFSSHTLAFSVLTLLPSLLFSLHLFISLSLPHPHSISSTHLHSVWAPGKSCLYIFCDSAGSYQQSRCMRLER